MTKRRDNLWSKEETREIIERINPLGFMKIPGEKFLVFSEKELCFDDQENLNFKSIGYGFAYTFNSGAKIIPIRAFKANVIAAYPEMVIYDDRVPVEWVSGLKDLQFKYKGQIFLYEIQYKD